MPGSSPYWCACSAIAHMPKKWRTTLFGVCTVSLLCNAMARSVAGKVGGWLYRTATNLGIDALRASGRRRLYEEAAGRSKDESKAGGPLDDLLREEKCRRVRAVLASIKPGQA